MRSRDFFQSIVGLLAVVTVVPAHAQTLIPTETPPATPVSIRAADLVITPRVGVSHSTSGGGYDGFTSFQGLIPLSQTPGNNLLYLLGQFQLDNDANPGGNLLLGYRTYHSGANRIYGGYLAYDNRDTGYSRFSQIGLGLETLGEAWDARLNAYVPVGDTRQTVGDRLFDTGLQLTNLRFQSNFLLASGSRQQQRIRDIEAAMAGFDLEAGGRLLRFPTGDLRAYAGLYYLAAGESAVGVRGRLEARPTDNLTVGFGVQHDRIFGTNVVATVALSLPGARPRGAAPASVLARMGEYPGRSYAIVVDRQRTIQITGGSFTDQLVLNPTTGQPYIFQHVILGKAGGNGTFENPFGQVQPALDVAALTPHSIVYVQVGTNPGIPGFIIPNSVQVLSTGPVQTISSNFGLLPLPLSGSGVLPLVNDTVTMRSDTVLSGFSISSALGAGVTFSNVNQVEVRDNIIQNTNDAGIEGTSVVVANLFDNQITATRNQGISLQDVRTANISDNTIEHVLGQGIRIANLTGSLNLNITNNQLRNNDDDAILIGLFSPGGGTAPATANIIISGNTIENNGSTAPIRGDGIGIGLEGNAVVNNLLIENNVIRNNDDDGIDIRLGLLSSTIGFPSTAQLTGTIRNNQITNSNQNGIDLRTYVNTRANVTIEQNTITRTNPTTTFAGIRLTTFEGGQTSAIVRSNTLADTPGNPGVLGETTPPGGFTGQRLCLNLSGNTSSTGYQLTSNPISIQEVSGNTNSGTITRTPPASTTPVSVCP